MLQFIVLVFFKFVAILRQIRDKNRQGKGTWSLLLPNLLKNRLSNYDLSTAQVTER